MIPLVESVVALLVFICLYFLCCFMWDQCKWYINSYVLNPNRHVFEAYANVPLHLPDSYSDFKHQDFAHASSHYYKDVMKQKNCRVNHVLSLPLDKQKEYADPVCKKYGLQVDQADAVEAVKSQHQDGTLNACTIGNLAWLSQFKPSYATLLQELREKKSMPHSIS